VEVSFGPGDKEFLPSDALEEVGADDDINTLLGRRVFTDATGLRRLLTYHKLDGDLTNIFYSMESNNTDFYAHQFKPVLKFVESGDGRILIADEVGLGKTIEAMYIWRELQAREDARRLLVVCPAKLREKWKKDLRRCFGIQAEIANAARVLEATQDVASRAADRFCLVAGIESLRPPRRGNRAAEGKKPRASQILCDLLGEFDADGERFLYDLVIIDEAHYMRNTETTNHRLGRLLGDCARHLVLLTATPIQTAAENLHSLLGLLDPARFQAWQMKELIGQHRHFVRAQRALWADPPEVEIARDALTHAQRAVALSSRRSTASDEDPKIAWVGSLLEGGTIAAEDRIEACRILDTASPLGSHLSRSLKRHVLRDRVRRTANTRSVTLTDVERAVYDRMSAAILERAYADGLEHVAHLMLVGRQRQLSSCFVAALERWDEDGLLEETVADELFDSSDAEVAQPGANHFGADDLGEALGMARSRIAELRAHDSKYIALLEYLEEVSATSPDEKIIVFAFFRATLAYVRARLERDGYTTALIQGGMKMDEREAVLARFAEAAGPRVLMSSEVGSEGIDLQFCRVVVNYDLPWNPMRVEQRIGRVDRLGQAADRITVVNLYCEETLEERIVQRLYDRIGVFEESIGDVEEIMGQLVQSMIIAALNPNLTDDERDELLRHNELAIANQLASQRDVEEGAANLAGFFDYILDVVNADRDSGRWIDGAELLDFVREFLTTQHRGVEMKPIEGESLAMKMRLSEAARRDFRSYLQSRPQGESTRLHHPGAEAIPLWFDPRHDTSERGGERVTFSHPLLGWVRRFYKGEQRARHPVAATSLNSKEFEVGTYLFYVGHWKFEGLRHESKLVFRAVRLESDEVVDSAMAERLVSAAAREGGRVDRSVDKLDPDHLLDAIDECRRAIDADLSARHTGFLAENRSTIDQLVSGVEAAFRRRETEMQAKLSALEAQRWYASGEDEQKLVLRIRAQKAAVTRARKAAEERVLALEADRDRIDLGFREVAAGVIQVAESS